MKRIVILLAIVGLCHLNTFSQKKYEMVVEKTDGTETVFNVEDLVRTYFRERTEEEYSGDNILVGEWQEINSKGNFLDDATDYEVHHMKLYPNNTGDYWSVTKGIIDKTKYSFTYSYTLNGTSGMFTMTITSSQNGPQVGHTDVVPFIYEYGIFDIGEISYKKIGGSDSGTGGGGNSGAYTTCPDDNHPHMIDLGLPRHTLWACCNVGASMPEDYGNYYAWGETSPKNVYNEDTYQYANNTSGFVNIGSDISGSNSYDAATVNWGAPWRMPTEKEIVELKNNTTSVWTTQNGVVGRKFTGANGGTIFLPFAGMRSNSELDNVGKSGRYWSSILYDGFEDGSMAEVFSIGSESASWTAMHRWYGYTIRPVRKN